MVQNSPILAYVAGGALIIGVSAGWKVRDWQCDAAYAKALEKAEKQRKELQGKVDEVSSLYEAERNKADVVVAGKTREIREIYRDLPPVPVDCAPDPRVIGLLESGISDANAAASSKPRK